ncbi:aminotransferase class V-fold PLP-dependent enzyme [Vagococcus coleopterorum]|uniref:cysteine desulfurase n=1 Tax=Vagococcus coleopterorum TaxID=2714946 RepID=A0A6G8ANX7_9ENTE|nr:aminotransferase class V-fold PLP-dependent enzyme [Vagococcus coleopterorum]QIL46697.1 aminotransferase class V-fold PLP-dependent enzyme [Vagococcus coleopterorum]
MECYFDYSATSLKKPITVIEKMTDVLQNNTFGNPARGGHDYSLNSYREVFRTRQAVADFFGITESQRVIFTMNATMGLNQVIKGLFSAGDHIITTNSEHNSVLRPLYQLEESGARLSFITCDPHNGTLQIEEAERLITPNTKAFVVTDASNVTGNITDLEPLATLCQAKNILLILDASQSAGNRVIDMKKEGIDILCFTGHKSLYGPQGIGGICFSEEIFINPLLVGGSGSHSSDHQHPTDYPTCLEAGTMNLPGIVGLHAGINYLSENGVEKLANKASKYAVNFYNRLKDEPLLQFYGDYSTTKRMPIVTFNIGDISSSLVADYLSQTYHIAVRSGLHCAPLIHKSFGTESQGMLRFSFSHFTTVEEIDYGVKAVKDIIDLVNRGEWSE